MCRKHRRRLAALLVRAPRAAHHRRPPRKPCTRAHTRSPRRASATADGVGRGPAAGVRGFAAAAAAGDFGFGFATSRAGADCGGRIAPSAPGADCGGRAAAGRAAAGNAHAAARLPCTAGDGVLRDGGPAGATGASLLKSNCAELPGAPNASSRSACCERETAICDDDARRSIETHAPSTQT